VSKGEDVVISFAQLPCGPTECNEDSNVKALVWEITEALYPNTLNQPKP